MPAAAHYINQCIFDYPLLRDHSAFAHGPHPFASRDYTREQCPMAKSILDTCVIIHINQAYTDEDLEDTVRAMERVVAWFRSKH